MAPFKKNFWQKAEAGFDAAEKAAEALGGDQGEAIKGLAVGLKYALLTINQRIEFLDVEIEKVQRKLGM